MEHQQSVQNLAVECYLLGEMTPDEREAFENHYFECAVCAEDLRSASQFIEDAKSIFAEKVPVPDIRAKQSRWNWTQWLTPQFAGAVIAVLVIVAGAETLGTIPSLRRQLTDASSPRVVNSTFLRPQTRGEPTVLRTVTGEPAVFIFDLPESPLKSSASDLQYVVKSADGREIFRLAGKTSGASEPVTLSIPKLDLPVGTYMLVVQTAGANSQELGQYPFEVKSK